MSHDVPSRRTFRFRTATLGLLVPLTVFLSSTSAMGQSTGRAPSAPNACALLTPDDIAKAANVKVGAGEAGQPIPGVLGRCTWSGTGSTKVIVTLTDTSHMETTIAAEMARAGHAVSGIGSKAVANRAAAMAGGYCTISLRPGRDDAVGSRISNRLPQVLVLVRKKVSDGALFRHVLPKQLDRSLQIAL